MPQTVAYRLTIRNASTVANPDGTADELVLTSDPVGTNPYIAAPPSGDGAEVDPLTGSVRTGAYVIEVVDADTGTDATGTLRVVTNKLEDATFRQQLLSRRAYVDVIRAGVSSRLVAGYISSVRLISPMRYAITVGDTRRVERTQTIFQGAALGAYTTRGCLTGGPVTADFGTVKARGGWRYLVSKSGDDVTLTFVDGYEPGAGSPIVKDWRQVNRSEIGNVIEGYRQPNPYAIGGGSAFVTSYTTPVFDFTSGDWIVAGGVQAVVGSTATNGAAVRALVCGYSEVPANEALGVSNVYLYWPSCPYSSGQTVYVSLTTVDVNETCPLYLDAHPVDLVTAIWTNARVKYSASAAATVKTLIGDTVRLACRFPQAPLMDEFLQQAIYGPFGISERTNSSGEQELFPTRIKTDVLPTLTVNAAAMRGADEVVFDLDEQTAVSGIRLTQQVLSPKGYAPGTQTQNGTNTGTQTSGPLDGIVVSEVTQTAQYLDPNLAVFAGRVVEYKIPGMIHTAADFVPNTSTQLDAIAIGTFDRFGRGCQAAEVSVLATAGAAAAQIGDEVYFEAPHFPNKGYRIGESTVGARIMQVVRRTETPAGPVFRLLDSGLAAQPVSPPATITVAQNPNAAATTARFTITNAATINSGGVLQVRVEWATGTTTPTGNGADFAFYAAGEVPTGAVDLPPVTTPGVTVYVRARTEQAGRRPSAWTAWASVALANIPAVVALSASNIKQTAATLSWTNTSSSLPLVVYAVQGGAPANWAPYRVGTLPAGTTSTVIRNLSGPSVVWTIGVAYETAQAVGSVVSTVVTTNSTLDTPSRPAGLAIIPGVDDATLTQGIALALWGSDQTLDIIIQRSLSAGSGFSTIATVNGATTVYVDQLPRTGTTYYYKIAHVLGGFTTSSFTAVVSGTAAGVPVNVTRPSAVAPVIRVETTETTTTGTITLQITDPQNRVEQVRFRERTNGGAWSGWTIDTTVPYSYSGTLPATGFLDIEYEVTGFDAAGTASQILAGGIESFDVGAGVANIVSAVGTFSLAGVLTVAVQADTDTNSFRYAIATTAWASDAAAYSAAQAGTLVNARNATLVLNGPYAVGSSVYVAFAGYTGASGTGTVSGPYRYTYTNGSRDTIGLMTRVRTTVTTATTLTIRVAVADPFPSVSIASISGNVVTCATAHGRTGTFVVTITGSSNGDYNGNWTATVTGETTFTIVIAIPPVPSSTGGTAAILAAIGYTITGLLTPTTTTGGSLPIPNYVTPAATITEAAGTYYDFLVTRPTATSAPGRIAFLISSPNRIEASGAATVPSQDVIGPSLKVVTTPGASSYSLVITWDGTIAYALDGVTQSVSGWTSPRTETITRGDIGANTQVAAFAVTKDTSTVSESVNIPPKDITSASLSIGTQTADDVTNIYEFDWTASNFPTGTTYDLNYRTVTTTGDVEEGYFSGLTVTNQDVTSGYTIGANPTYQMTVSAVLSGAVLMSRSRTGTFLT